MQISRSARAGWPMNRPTSSSRSSGCSPTPPACSCSGRWPTANCPSTIWPGGSASPRRRCRNTWPSCGWRGWCVRGARAPRCSTGSRTTTSASSSPTPCTTPNTPPGGVPAHHLDDGELRVLHEEDRGLMGLRRLFGLRHGHHSHDHVDSVDAPCATARPVSAPSRSACGARHHRRCAACHRRGVGFGRAVRRHRAQLLRRADRGAAVDRFAMSRRAATRRYTYGFGRVEDLAGLFVVR